MAFSSLFQMQTAVLTNSYEAAQRLRREGPKRKTDNRCHHQHLKLEGGTRRKQAQVYPRLFHRPSCEGIAAHRGIDAMNLVVGDVTTIEELQLGRDSPRDNHM